MSSRSIRGFAESLLCVFSYGTIMDSRRGFVDIVKLPSVFIVSLITYSGSASQNVLHMKLLISNLHSSVLSHHRLLVKHVFIRYYSASPRVEV